MANHLNKNWHDRFGKFLELAGLTFDYRKLPDGEWPLGVNGRRLPRLDYLRRDLAPVLAMIDHVGRAGAVVTALGRQGWEVGLGSPGEGWAGPDHVVVLAVRGGKEAPRLMYELCGHLEATEALDRVI